MLKKSLFFGAAALALLVLFAFVGCSNPASESTQYVAQAASDYPYPEDTVFVSDRAALDGLLNDYDVDTNKVRNIAYSGAIGTQLEIPAGKTVYLNPPENIVAGPPPTIEPVTLTANIVVNEGAKLVLVSPFQTSTGVPSTPGKILVHGAVEVFKYLGVGNSALDVADYTVENGLVIGRNTVIGQKVTILPGATLVLKPEDIIPPDQNSGNKFTPTQAWAAAGQGSLRIDGALSNYDYEVKDLLTGVYPSASRKYYVESSRTGTETLPAVIPLGAYITTSATPRESDGNTLTVNGFLKTAGTLEDITEITVGNGGGLELSQTSGDVLNSLTKLTVGPGASFEVDKTSNVTLQSLETLFLGDGSSFTVNKAGNSVTFTQAEGKKLVTTLGKKVYYLVGIAADAIVDVKITDDASLITGSRLTVNPGSTFIVDAGKTLTVEGGAQVNFTALTPPAAAGDPAPVIISGALAVESGATVYGPALDPSDPDAFYETFTFEGDGKAVLDTGADFFMGAKQFIGATGDGATYETANGAQIELNAAGFIMRDTGAAPAGTVTVKDTLAVIIKGHSLTLETGLTLKVDTGNQLWFVGGTEADGDGAILKGAGKLVAASTEIVGGPFGWQAVGDSIAIGTPDGIETNLKSDGASTGGAFKALGSLLGATITQKAVASNSLNILANTTIDLGGSSQRKVGEIVLVGDGTNPGTITFTDATSKIITGNTAGSGLKDALDTGGVTAITGSAGLIGIVNVLGDGSNTEVTTTAVANADLLPAGFLVELVGGSGGGTVTAGAATPTNDGHISAETPTVADNT
jgi:hypothetical protein